jgi:hypothetical protein
MTEKRKIGAVFMLMLILSLSACAGTGAEGTAGAPMPTPTSTTPIYPLATPVSQEPAAGICASFEGEAVVISIYPDIPDPRCAKVRAEQKLTVINRTEGTLQVSIGTFEISLEPGGEYTFDTPIGKYLAPGVHLVNVSPCCSPELWLEEK